MATVKSGVPFSMIRTTTSRPLNLAVIKSLSGGFENLYISAKGELISFFIHSLSRDLIRKYKRLNLSAENERPNEQYR